MMHTMSDHTGGAGGIQVLPFDGMGLYEQPRAPRFVFKMPRVVPDQKTKFESDELFRRLSRESEVKIAFRGMTEELIPPERECQLKVRFLKVKYTGFRDRPVEERQVRFQTGCREGHTEIAFAATGTNLQLIFGVGSGNYVGDPRECDFDKEHGKVRETCPGKWEEVLKRG